MDVLLNRLVPAPVAVSEVVALIDQHDAIPRHFRQFIDDGAERHYFCRKAVTVSVVVPKRNEILRTNNKASQKMGLLENASQGRRHDGLAKTNYVADDHSAALIQIVSRDPDGYRLKWKKLRAEVLGNRELGKAGACLLRKVVGHLEVDVVRRDGVIARLARIDDFSELLGNVDAPCVIPLAFKPSLQLVAGVLVENIHVQITLIAQARERQIAASHEADAWVIGVGAMSQV